MIMWIKINNDTASKKDNREEFTTKANPGKSRDTSTETTFGIWTMKSLDMCVLVLLLN